MIHKLHAFKVERGGRKIKEKEGEVKGGDEDEGRKGRGEVEIKLQRKGDMSGEE